MLVMSAIAAVWSYADLIKDLVKHNKAQPLATRLALCFALVLNCAGVIAADGSPGDLVLSAVYAGLSLAVVVLTFFRRETRVTLVDVLCIAVSVAGAIAFAWSGQSAVGIACAIGADLVAYVPTIRASRKYPETQPLTTYLIGIVAAAFAFAADCVHGGIQVSSMFTIYLILIDGFLAAIIYFGKGADAKLIESNEVLNEA